MEISFKNKNKNSTFRPLQSMICYVTNWRIINAPLKLELYLSNFRGTLPPIFFGFAVKWKISGKIFSVPNPVVKRQTVLIFHKAAFKRKTNFIAGDHAFFVIANVFFVRRFYFAQMFGKNIPFFVAVWILVAKWLNVINIIFNKVNPLFCLPHTKSSQAVWHFLKPCTELFLFQLKKKSQERIVFLQLLLV